MAYRSNVGQLANVIAQGGAQRAQSLADQWAMGPQAVQATIGGYRDEIVRQQEEQYRANQDQYYETQRQRVVQELKATERATEVDNIVLDQIRDMGALGRNPQAVRNHALDGDYDADVVAEFDKRALQLEDSRMKGIQDQETELRAASSFYARATQEIGSLLSAGDGAGYDAVRSELMQQGIKVGISEQVLAGLLPMTFERDVLENTANIGRTETNRAAREALLLAQKRRWGGWVFSDDPLERADQRRASDKIMVSGLLTANSQEEVNRFWAWAEGEKLTMAEFRMMSLEEQEDHNARQFPKEMLDEYSEYKTFTDDNWNRLNKTANSLFGVDPGSFAEEWRIASLNGDLPEMERIANRMALFEKVKAEAEGTDAAGGTAGTRSGGDVVPATYSQTSTWLGKRDDINSRTYTSDDLRPPPNRYNSDTGEWEQLNASWGDAFGDLQEADPDLKMSDLTEAQWSDLYNNQEDVPEDERWYNEDQADKLRKTIDNAHFRAARIPNDDQTDEILDTINTILLDDQRDKDRPDGEPSILDTLGLDVGGMDFNRAGPGRGVYLNSLDEDIIWMAIKAMSDEDLEDMFSPWSAAAIRARADYRDLDR